MATSPLNLPEGFELESPVQKQGIALPRGFELERPRTAKTVLPKGFELEDPETVTKPPIATTPSATDTPFPSLPFYGRAADLAIKALSYTGKGVGWGLGKGLGVVAWPLERIERGIATPLAGITREKAKRFPMAPSQPVGAIEQVKRLFSDPTWAEVKGAWPDIKAGAKAFIPWKGMAPLEETSNFVDLIDRMHILATGYSAPTWEKNIFGIALSFAVTPTAAAKIAKTIRGGIRLTGIPTKFAAKTLPTWQRAKLITRAETGARMEKAGEVGKLIEKKEVRKLAHAITKESGKPISTQAVEYRLGQLVKGGITTKPELAKAIHPAIEQLEANAKTLRKLGILGKETYLTKLPRGRIVELTKSRAALQQKLTKFAQRRFPGKAEEVKKIQTAIKNVDIKLWQSTHLGGKKYMPRMYRTKEEERLARKFLGWSKHKIRAHYAKQRKPIPEEARRLMGEIKEPTYPITKRLVQQSADIETAKLYKFAAEQPGWASKAWASGLSKKALPDTKAYGALRGMFVHPKVYSDVTELNRIRGSVEQVYDTAIGAWKMGKVVLNPSTHMRNKISNKILLDMSDMGYIQQAKYAAKTLNHARKKTEEYKIAKRYFARTTQVSGELLDDLLGTTAKAKGVGFEKGLNATKRGIKWATKKPAELYQHEEFANKFMKYLQQRDRGKSVIESVEAANKWLFDYGELATWEKNIARRIIPFYTFPRKALPRVLECAIERPLTLAKYPLAAEVMTRYSLAKLEITEKDWEQIQDVLPKYMDRGSYMLMPYRDKNGDLRFFDWTYILPWGELSQIGESTNVGNILLSNPMVRIPAELAANKSIWSGRKIYDDSIPLSEMTPEYRREQTAKAMKYFWGTIAPSLAPKGLYWDRIIEAVAGKPIKTVTLEKKKRLLPETIAHTLLGLRTQAIDIEDQQYYRLWEKQQQIKEITKNMNDAEKRHEVGNISEKEYQKRQKMYIEQMKNVIKRAEVIAK